MNAPAAAWLALALLSLCVLVELAYFGDFRIRSGVPGGASSFFGVRVRNATSDRNENDEGDEGGGARDPGIRAADGTFPGAPDWDDHWGHRAAARRGRERPGEWDERAAKAVESSTQATLLHLEEMRRRYEGVGALADFYARGLGWIRDRLGMALTVVVAGDFADGSADEENVALNAGIASVFVVDVIGEARCRGGSHPPLTMWARANGPEVFAGTPMPHAIKGVRGCAWRYDFEPTRAGVYSIHVKVLTFNGFADTLAGDCQVERIPSRNDTFDEQKVEGDDGLAKLEAINAEVVEGLAERWNYTQHRGLSGFKMYSALDACCEACTRARNCRMWSLPGAGHYDNCELYFDRMEDDVDFLDRRDGRYLGRERNYSYVRQNPRDFPNVRRRLSSGDARNAAHRRLAISASEILKFWPMEDIPSTGRPRGGEATPYFLGCGWSSLLSFESPCHYPSDDLVFGSGKKVTIVAAETPPVEDPRSCTLDDERLDVANGRWVRYPYPEDSICGTMEKDISPASFREFRPVYRGDRPPECWYRDDLRRIATGCEEPGCKWVISHRWMTDLKREVKWFGAWESHDCGYRVMGDAEIQQCVDRKKISKIIVKGKSIKNLLDGYLNQKLRSIKMIASDAENGTRSVFLDTLQMPHLLWNKSAKKHRADLEDLRAFPNVTGSGDEHYWITGFYYTSEREPHVVVDRSLQFSRLAWDVLTPKGYRMINALDVTAAFAFDTDGQADGMHISGPPAKAILTKFLHHLCHDVLPLPDE